MPRSILPCFADNAISPLSESKLSYTKLSNLEIMVSNLENKNELLPMMDRLVNMILENFDHIKNELMKNKLTSMDNIIHEVLVDVEV